MRAIDFPEANRHYTKPDSMTDEQCHPISAYVGEGEDGLSYINTVWMPNKEDIEAIVAGRPIVVTMLGDTLRPHSIFTCDEEGNING